MINLVIVIKAILFVLLIALFYLMFRYIEKNNLIKSQIENVFDKTNDAEKQRKDKERKIYYEEGATEKKDLFIKLDSMIITSNIRNYFPFLNTEIYLFLLLLSGAAGFFIAYFISRKIGIGIGTFIVIIVIYNLIVYILSTVNYKKTEEQIITFVNLLENYSKTNDNIIVILGKVYPYLEEPLKSAIEECYIEVINTGDISTGLNNLKEKIEHEKFRQVIGNLEICNRYEANYEEIIKGNREMLQDFVKDQEEKKAIMANGRIEVALLFSIGWILLYFISKFVTVNIPNMLLSTAFGNAIIMYFIVILLASIWMLLTFGKEK